MDKAKDCERFKARITADRLDQKAEYRPVLSPREAEAGDGSQGDFGPGLKRKRLDDQLTDHGDGGKGSQ